MTVLKCDEEMGMELGKRSSIDNMFDMHEQAKIMTFLVRFLPRLPRGAGRRQVSTG